MNPSIPEASPAGDPDKAGLMDALRGRLRGSLVTDATALLAYRQDEARSLVAGQPLAAVVADSREDVIATLQLAREHGVPVVPRGAGSGLSGGANAIDACIVLSLERMNRIVEIDVDDMVAVVEPGVINNELRSVAAEVGLFYPPDPSSYEFSTLGGNVATNAGGLCCVKYGVTRDAVLGLKVVLGDGRTLRTGRRSVKGVAGYDLTALFVGSEGTLGVVTEATLRLRPAPPPPMTVLATFAALDAAAEAASQIRRVVAASMLELMDAATIEAIEHWKQPGLDTAARAIILAQSDAGAQAAEDALAMEEICRAAGALDVSTSGDITEGAYLVGIRRMAYPALQQLGETLLDDIAVPCGRIAELCRGVEDIGRRRAVSVATFGHAGDGNMHPTLVFDRSNADHVAAARDAFDDIVRLGLSLGGTITGEHGNGVLKARYLEDEVDPANYALQRSLKDLLDPDGILNPGKVLRAARGRTRERAPDLRSDRGGPDPM